MSPPQEDCPVAAVQASLPVAVLDSIVTMKLSRARGPRRSRGMRVERQQLRQRVEMRVARIVAPRRRSARRNECR